MLTYFSVSSLPAEPSPIDFGFFKSAIKTNTYVDQIKASVREGALNVCFFFANQRKQFESKKFVYPEDKLSAAINEEHQASVR